MTDEIKVKFSDESWEKIVALTEETSELEGLRRLVRAENDSKSLSLREVLEFNRQKPLRHETDVRINHLLQNAEIVLPSPPVVPRSEELQTRIEKLKAQQQEREYNKMIENLKAPTSSHTGTARVPMVSGLNFAVTVIATVFGACFALKSVVPDLLVRGAIGFAVGILLMCIEIFLSVRAVMKEEEDQSKKRR